MDYFSTTGCEYSRCLNTVSVFIVYTWLTFPLESSIFSDTLSMTTKPTQKQLYKSTTTDLEPSVEKTILYPLDGLETLAENQLPQTDTWIYFWILSSIPLISISLLVSLPHCIDYHCFVVSFETGSRSSISLFFFFQVILAILGPLQFYMDFRIDSSVLTKKLAEILIVLSLHWRVLPSKPYLVFQTMNIWCLIIQGFYNFFQQCFVPFRV